MRDLEKTKEFYRKLKPEEFKERLSLNLTIMKETKRTDSEYSFMLNIAQENNLLTPEEINHYKQEEYKTIIGVCK
jgi:hypothetical protein